MVLSHFAERVKIFFSLAPATEDRNLFEQLRNHLSAMRLQGLIDLWYDSEISPGSNARDIVRSHISTADIIVLLISADFFASDQCARMEMPYALEQSATRAAHVVPVLLRPIEWSGLPLEKHSPLPPDGRPVSTWENLDTALKEVAQGIRRIVEELARRWTSAPRPVKPPQFPLSTLPYRRNPFFTDRDTILKTLHASFTSGQNHQTNIQALYGLGGIGKTLLAIEYAYLHQEDYQATLWLNAASRELLNSDLRSLADQLGISLPKDVQESERLVAIKHWLQQHDRWLLVLDNLDDFSILDQLIPLESSGHVLLTTHSQATGPFAHAIAVDQMSIDEGALLLLRRAKIISEKGEEQDASAEDYLQARAIAQEFASYPLALDQAGAYIEETQRSLASYLSLYRERQAAFLSIRGRFVNDHPDPVTTTLSLTFEKIAQVDPHALELLRLFAFLHAEALPDEMITRGTSSLAEPLRSIALDPLALDSAIATLRRFSLVRRCADSTTLTMHQIVQVVLKKELTKQQQTQLAKQAVRLVNAIFPEVSFQTWNECERYAPQAQYCATLIDDFQLTLPEGALLLERLGFYYYQRGSYSEAGTLLTQALHLQERQRHTDPLDMAQTLNSLGLLASRQAQYQEAEAFHLRALKLREQEPGAEAPTTMESLHNLAGLYESYGQYQQAEQYYLRVLAIDEREVGADHPDIAKTLNNLALVHYLQDHYEQAETMYQRALAIYEQASYADHPDITYTLNGLGTLYETQGNYQQAETLYRRALSIREQALGEKHSETAHSINKLAHIIELQGDYQQAEALYRQSLTIMEQVMGLEHPDVALLLNNLALLMSKQGQYQQAEPLYQRALRIYEQMLGSEHPTVARVRGNLEQLRRKLQNEGQDEADLSDK
ncbi:MAG TPA: FxSxx-COOH system tetratricopeptide repeat protein [Ktedonobacteraceae bacterium]|nr:FxSxx-COOH system tetratricopeptide repeat protein [Ktedonobacteraceae bacterium]